jgi:hypothetical protein
MSLKWRGFDLILRGFLKKLDLALIVSEHLPKATKRIDWNAWT